MTTPVDVEANDGGKTYPALERSLLEDVDYSRLYDTHDEYVSRREEGSWEAQQIVLECREFKLPHLLALVPGGHKVASVIEVGCATGELLAAFPDRASDGGLIAKRGFDVSPLNIEVARRRYRHISFSVDAFDSCPMADVVILSDVLEHVPNDTEFLRRASCVGRLTLINLPLEDNWLNRHRSFGVNDPSGHLRAYSLESANQLLVDAGLRVLYSQQVWSHETEYDIKRRQLRARLLGHSHDGKFPIRLAKAFTHGLARRLRPFGRWLFPSNLFVSASRREDTDGQ